MNITLKEHPGFDPHRVAQCRRNVADGAYDEPGVLDVTADRVLASIASGITADGDGHCEREGMEREAYTLAASNSVRILPPSEME